MTTTSTTGIQPGSSHRLDDDPAFALHRGGKLAVVSSVLVDTPAALALAYTPGVARVCSAIAESPWLARDYTWASRVVAVITDGTAVLGLGDIGPVAAMPVMEGKSLLFKQFGGLDSVPLCLDCTGVDELVDTVVRLAPSFGGINLEDISAPRCFEVERRLREALDIPVFHDDQHGTAIVVLAALRNAANVVGKTLAELRIVVAGAGASGVAVSRILLDAGADDLVVSDSKGLLHTGRAGLSPVKAALAADTNPAGLSGTTESALRGADVFIGLSGGIVPEEAIASMAPGAIVFALSNPIPEIHPEAAARHVSVVATGRSDFPNQINNVLAFPGVFRGAIDSGATEITENMKLAAARVLSELAREKLGPRHILPSPFDARVAPAVALAVAEQARRDGVTPTRP
jgi:malate dehydrogenase (oxaloacetate-decarboxylating)